MERSVNHSLVKALKGVPGFGQLEERDLLEIVGASVNLFWPAGSVVFAKGSPGEALYVVLSGRVRIFDEIDGHEIEIAETHPGDFFGEISLLLETTHTKTVQAVEDTELLVLMKGSFRALLDMNPALAEHLRQTLETRKLETESKYRETQATEPAPESPLSG